jgi:hypothetical protein
MLWLLDLRQAASYRLSYAHGRRNRKPYRCPWWADQFIYGVAFMDGFNTRRDR